MTSREDLLKMFGLKPHDMGAAWSKFKSVLNHIQELELQLEQARKQRCPNCIILAKQANDLRDHYTGVIKTLAEVCGDAVRKCTEVGLITEDLLPARNIAKINGKNPFSSFSDRLLHSNKVIRGFFKDFPKEKDVQVQ